MEEGYPEGFFKRTSSIVWIIRKQFEELVIDMRVRQSDEI